MEIKVIASGSSGNAYLVSDGKTALLLDAGVPFKRIQVGCDFQTSRLAACLVTHRHGDHSKAVPRLLERGVPVCSTSEVAGIHKGVIAVKPLHECKVGTFTFLPFPVEHDVECYGYLLKSAATGEKLVYITDTAYIRYTFDGLTHIMAEANYSQDIIKANVRHDNIPLPLAERIVRTHMCIETLLGLLKANDTSRVRQIYLLHLSNTNSNAEDFKRQVQCETGAEVYVF